VDEVLDNRSDLPLPAGQGWRSESGEIDAIDRDPTCRRLVRAGE
jgi:hypothetical protein